MKTLRIAAAALVIAATLAALHFACVEPLQRNARAKRLQNRTIEALNGGTYLKAAAIARENLAELDAPRSDWNLDLLMIKAANFRILGNRPGAISAYERALKLDRRPEIYLNLGEILLANRQVDAAVRAFVRACEFDPRLARNIRNEAVRARVEAEAK